MHPIDNSYQDLCHAIEGMLRHEVHTPKDFEELHEQIFARTHVLLSLTTLKRVWGYVNYEYAPSLRTLNTLAQFLGYADYKLFCEHSSSSDTPPSNIIISNYLDVAEDLVPDDELTLYWLPDRECHIRYLGDTQFVVIASANTRLLQGANFSCRLIIEGEPLYLSHLLQGDRPPVSYVCGKQGGIRFVEKCKNITN